MNGKGPTELDRMSVKITHLDRLLGLTGEIIITAGNISILQRYLQGWAGVLDKTSLEMARTASLTANRISSDLHHLVMDIRLIPIKDTFLRFRRLVRDLAKKKGRQVNFEIVGEDTLVDKTVAEKLYEPLAHQIRNAIDHGLEDPLERKHRGKDPVGRLTLTAYKKEGFTYVRVADDGNGLDEKRILEIAIDKGLVHRDAAAGLSGEEVRNLIFQPGFSTTREATEISGRGVGMDVVKNMVENLGGEVIIESEPGRGGAFTYKIPQLSAVNITDALIIRAEDDYFALPIGNVVATQAFEPEDLHTAMVTNESIFYLGAIIPLHDLRTLLYGGAERKRNGIVQVIIIEAKNGRIALKVSEFIRPQKLVLIPLPDVFHVSGVSGTTVLGGNQLGLVLDPFELVALATGSGLDASEDRYLSREAVVLQDETGREETRAAGDVLAEDEATAAKAAVDREDTAVMDEKMAEEFFLEIQDILKSLNEDIFQMEKEPENSRHVNTVFRHFHSIKGNLIMTGFTDLGNFVHDAESVLDRIRNKELQVDSDLIDLLLDVLKVLESALQALRAGRNYEVRDLELRAALDKYRPEEVEEEPVEGEDDGVFHLTPLAQLVFHSKQAGNSNIFQSMIRFKPDFQASNLTAFLILKRLALIGDVIATIPQMDRMEKGYGPDALKVMFATTHDPEDVDRFMRRQLMRHYGVTGFDNLLVE